MNVCWFLVGAGGVWVCACVGACMWVCACVWQYQLVIVIARLKLQLGSHHFFTCAKIFLAEKMQAWCYEQERPVPSF
jgi:hypothetical protein